MFDDMLSAMRSELPLTLRTVMRCIRKAVEVCLEVCCSADARQRKFSTDSTMVVGGLFLHRLVCPSLRHPSKSGIAKSHPDPATASLLCALAAMLEMLQVGSLFPEAAGAERLSDLLSRTRPALAEAVALAFGEAGQGEWQMNAHPPVGM